MRNRDHQKSKIMRIVTLPLTFLSKATDSYVRSMNRYANTSYVGGGAAAAFGPSMAGAPLPRSFSTSSATMRVREEEEEADLRDLVRAVSTKALGERIDLSRFSSQEKQGKQAAWRSGSVGMGKIDEDMACEFGEDEGCDGNSNEKKKKGNVGGLIPRSQSQAVSRTTNVGF